MIDAQHTEIEELKQQLEAMTVEQANKFKKRIIQLEAMTIVTEKEEDKQI